MRKLALSVVSVLTLGSLVVGCGKSTATTDKTTSSANSNFKVGLVTDVGGLNDHGFNYLSNQGLEKAEKQLGIKGSVVQSQSSADYVPNLQKFAQQDYNVVIAVGFMMDQAVKEVAPQYPNTKFLIIDDAITNVDNVSSAIFKTEQCGYLVGAMAGLVEKQGTAPGLNKENTLGVVGGMKIPSVDSYIAGFQQGVEKTDPGAKVEIKYANSFTDTTLGNQIAKQEISDGADIIFQVAGGVGIGVINAAKSSGVYAIGVDADQNYLAPETVITSALKGVDTSTFDVIQQTLNNQFKSGIQYFDLNNNGVGFANGNDKVSSDIMKQVNDLAQQIKDNKITVSTKVK